MFGNFFNNFKKDGESKGGSGAGGKSGDAKKKDKKDKSKKDDGRKNASQPSAAAATSSPETVNQEDLANASEAARFEDLRSRLEVTEMDLQRSQDSLEQMEAQKMALERDISSLRSENEQLRSNAEAMVAEKWELSAANADLQNRLQTMAITYMQGRPDEGMLQEELRKMQMSLAEERKVTEKLSRSLELEKRRSESLEQKVKGTHRRSAGSSSGGGSNHGGIALPDEIRNRDEQVTNSMEKYRIHCDNLAMALEECAQKLMGFEIQEDYHVADLRKELSNVKKVLADEVRRSSNDSNKVSDVQHMFSQMLKDYNSAVDKLNQLQQDKRIKCQQIVKDSDEPKEASNVANVENLQAKLTKTTEDLRDEKIKVQQLVEKIKNLDTQLEELPLLQAQVDVYRADFNAERQAREEIAGEKADLQDEVRRLKELNEHRVVAAAETRAARRSPSPKNHRPSPVLNNHAVRETVNHFAAEYDRHQADTNPTRASQRRETGKTYSCPKCNKGFPIVQLLQNHVNDCLDRP